MNNAQVKIWIYIMEATPFIMSFKHIYIKIKIKIV